MKIAAIAFTKNGAELAIRLSDKLQGCTPYAPLPYSGQGVHSINGTLNEWTGRAFETHDGIVFIGACGIAVRAIAPFVKNKLKDPAIVVVDEKSKYAISLLSGHVGGANALALLVADAIGADPVITTATDCNNIFSVDEWAVRSGMNIANPERIKDISGALLAGKQIGLKTSFEVVGKLPAGVVDSESAENGICISLGTEENPYEKTLVLIPMILHLGIGCRKGVCETQIKDAVSAVLSQNDISPAAIKDISSIDLKENEPGLRAFCKTWHKPFYVYKASLLAEIKEQVSASEFVKEITGVDNVCERAALFSAGKDASLLIPKSAIGQVTVALAAEFWRVEFE